MHNNDNMRHRRGKGFLFLLFPVFLFGITAIVMWLWNALLPEILGVKAITYWQAMGILVLSKILFGGFGGGGKDKHSFGDKRREKWMQKWRGMSDEDRDKFREQWRKRCRPDSE